MSACTNVKYVYDYASTYSIDKNCLCMHGWMEGCADPCVCVCVCLFLHTLLSPGAPNLQELQIRIFLDGSSRIAGAGA